MLTKGWPQQRRILITKWTGWPILWIPVSLFPSHPYYHPIGSWTKQPRWQGWRLCMDSATRPTWLQSLLSALPANSRDQHWAPDVAPSPGWSASYLAAGWLHWITSITEEAVFCPYCPYSGYDSLPTLAMLLPKLPSVWTYRMPPECGWALSNLLRDWIEEKVE